MERVFENSDRYHKLLEFFRFHIKSSRVDINRDNPTVQ